MKNLIIVLWQAFLMFVAMPLALFVSNVFIGALFGWVVGLFFGNTILGILAQIGISGISMWQFGAFLGFIASFFRNMITFNNKQSFKKQQDKQVQRPLY